MRNLFFALTLKWVIIIGFTKIARKLLERAENA